MTVALDQEPTETDSPEPKPILWVRPTSNVHAIAHTIATSIVEDRKITLRAIGAGAINQAIKATIKARQQLASRGENLYLIPGMVTVDGGSGDEVTAVVLHCLLMQ